MSKEYLGKTTVASLIRLIKTELKKYVKMESMNERIPAPKTDDNGKFVKVVDGKYQPVEHSESGGTTDHSALTNRNLPNQHPIGVIEGLDETLGNTEEALDS